jgi:hypothetical protein
MLLLVAAFLLSSLDCYYLLLVGVVRYCCLRYLEAFFFLSFDRRMKEFNYGMLPVLYPRSGTHWNIAIEHSVQFIVVPSVNNSNTVRIVSQCYLKASVLASSVF